MNILLNSFWEIFFLALGLASFVLVGVKRFDLALCSIIFLAPLYLLKIRIFFIPFSVLEILIFLALAIWIFKKQYRFLALAQIKFFILPALLIFIGAAGSTLFSKNINISAGILKGWFLAPVLFAMMLFVSARWRAFFEKAVFSFILSVGAVGLISLCFFLAGQKTFDGRLAAFFLSPNYLAMYLSPGFVVGLAFWDSILKKGKMTLTLFLLSLVFSGVALYLTFSYAAWLGVAVAVFFWIIIASGYRFRIGAILLLLMFIFFLQVGSSKLDDLFSSPRSSWQSRLMIWRAASEIIKENPFLGIGPGMFQDYYLKYQSKFPIPYLEWAVPQPHNIFLAFWLQTGILGLAGFAWLLISFFKKTLFLLFKQKNQLALILLLPMVYFIVHGLADTPYFKNDLALIFWVLIALAAALIIGNGDAPKQAIAAAGK
ncbi:MAG: O-antigen ligase family protein [Candidatus Portnoybacteria bacterium]|nr:O-antigen ligase family protein [Candidatus Portnoybacteria bacterium]